MGVASARTLVPIDKWATFMGIPGWLFNQVYNPDIPLRGAGDVLWYQGHGLGTYESFVGREEVGDAMAEAERMVANALSYWPGRTWIAGEEHSWIRVKRGVQEMVPRYYTTWKNVHLFGIEAWTDLNIYPTLVVYAGTTATVTFATTVTAPEEIVIVPFGCDPTTEPCEIRPLTVTITGGVCTATGPKWLFVRPEYRETLDNDLALDDDAYFVTAVEAYRHYTDTTQQARYVWIGTGSNCSTTLCAETCVDGCANVLSRRDGKFEVWPASYSGGTWSMGTWPYSVPPSFVRVWYETRYSDKLATTPTYGIPVALEAAIFHLTNILLPDEICGTDYTKSKFARDREQSDNYDWSVATAMRYFGTTQRGAVLAAGLLNRLEPQN